MKRISAEIFPLPILLFLLTALLFLAGASSTSAQSNGCVIPASGPWPPCATGGGGTGTPAGDCVIPQSGPWPPCATGGASNGESNNECIIPASGPWPPCATGGGNGNDPAASEGGCAIPASGPWPPCATGGGGGGSAASPTIPGSISLNRVASGFAQPVYLTHAGDGRIFVVEKVGRVRFMDSKDIFLEISGRVNSSGGEQGLLSIAFHPNYRNNGRLFAYYINRDGAVVISEFSASGNRADAGSEKVIMRVDQPFGNHNGGQLKFGRDGYLYIGLGDGGAAGDPLGHGQNQMTLLGSMLRIDINQGSPYSIPPENPFQACPTCLPGGQPEIIAIGLRNPWRFSFDRANGDMYIGDVGQDQREEISFLANGSRGLRNFGWNAWEGNFCFSGNCSNLNHPHTPPVIDYDHSQGCSVTGGYVYRGGNHAAWRGVYFYGDFCSGNIWATVKGAWRPTLVAGTDIGISSFGEDAAGELYVLGIDGSIYQIGR